MDILESEKRLKEMPFSVPDGYFDKLQRQVMERIDTSAADPVPSTGRSVTYRILQITVAASITAAVIMGGFSLAGNISDARQEERMLDESFFYTELMPSDTDILYDADSYGYIADTGPSEEDIIDYLIYTGTPVELLNESDYE